MRSFLIFSMLLTILSCKEEQPPMEFNNIAVTYPETRKDTLKEDYHGEMVNDPYRWLEDDMSEETADWVKRQNEVTFSYLDSIPFRSALKDRLAKLWDYE